MAKKPKIVALVPMRHDSKRVSGKNYRLFNGRPLFCQIVDALLKCPSIDAVYINTDSPVIKRLVQKHYAKKVFIIDRPKRLCSDKVPMNDILLYDIDRTQADYYLQTHSTNPLLKSQTIEKAIAMFFKGNYDSLFSVTKWQTRFYDYRGKPVNHDPKKLIRTQDLKPIYEENSNIYIFTKKSLQKNKTRIGKNPLMFEIPRLEAVDIDEEKDFLLAQTLARKRIV